MPIAERHTWRREGLGHPPVCNAMLEMGALSVLILALVVSLFLLRKPRVGRTITHD